MRATVIVLLVIMILIGPAAAQTTWTLTWSDEFNGSALDTTKWTIEVGTHRFGANQLQVYTDRADNIYLADGNLVIQVLREDYPGSIGTLRPYTSGRIKTQGKFGQAYGRFEARIRIPYGQGLHPAFWMMGDNYSLAVDWPACGEIDIMENVGREPSTVWGSISGPGDAGKFYTVSGSTVYASVPGSPTYTTPGAPISRYYIMGKYELPRGIRFADNFYVFAIEWEPSEIRYYVDGNHYATRRPKELIGGMRWVFNRPFFMILNVGVGGTSWVGVPDNTTVFPQKMLVDYVRVYQK